MSRTLLLLGILSYLYMVTMVTMAVPVNADESVQYHVIACNFYPNAKYHVFWNPCDGSTDLNLFGLQLKRSYNYIGALSSYIYYPFFLVYPSILTQRLLGLIFLVAFVSILTFLERENKSPVLIIFGLSFPLIYQLINDTGPVRYGLFMTVAAPWLVRQSIGVKQQGASKALLNILLGVLLFLAIEDKPFFVYVLPSVILLIVAYNVQPQERRLLQSIWFVLRQIWLGLSVMGGLACLYFFAAKTSSNDMYIADLIGSVKTYMLPEIATNLASYMVNFGKFSSMVYERAYFSLLNIPFSLLIWLAGVVFIGKIAKIGLAAIPTRIVVTGLAFILNVCVFFVTRNTWASHHFIFPYVFALLIICQSMAYIASRKYFLVIYSVFSIVLASELWFSVPSARSSWERYEIFKFLQGADISEDYIIAHLSLGTYYVASLYGPKDQISLQIRHLDGRTATNIIRISDTLRRRILCVCRGADCNAANLSARFMNKVTFEQINLLTGDWKVFCETKRIYS